MSDTQLIQVTESADTALGAFDFSAHQGKGVRVFIQGFGWSGPALGMALDEPNDKDEVISQGDYAILVDPQTKDIVDQSGGLTIDYVDEAHQKGYLLRLNKASGGCGSDGGGCSGCG